LRNRIILFAKAACDLRPETVDPCGMHPRGDARFEEAKSGRRISHLQSDSKPEVK
jgi:hypothetical protein